jgi:magnesium transporter
MIATCPSGDLRKAAWIDLLSPTASELAQVKDITGLRVPTLEQVIEIESTSRLSFEKGAYYLTTPLVTPKADGDYGIAAAGFVLAEKHLLTVRFEPIAAIEAALTSCEAPDAAGAFLHILEVIVDRAADALERASLDCDGLVHDAFGKAARDRRRSADLRDTLRRVGSVADKTSHIRDALLGLGRIAAYLADGALEGAPQLSAPRLKAIRADIVSLTEYESHLSSKIQFLLDATLGFINVEQNDVVKTLTIASVVGIPPVLIAGIYGMNFRDMPEYGWKHGYPYSLVLMAVTSFLTWLWFKRRGWT